MDVDDREKEKKKKKRKKERPLPLIPFNTPSALIYPWVQKWERERGGRGGGGKFFSILPSLFDASIGQERTEKKRKKKRKKGGEKKVSFFFPFFFFHSISG